eukprot:scaffold1885_cov267-Chaetoceros_neogracile.AAC.4
MKIHLVRLSPPEHAGFVKEFVTNLDGRFDCGPALKGGDYFARKNATTSGVPFVNDIPLRFGIDDPEEHYHVPLLVSPWSYSTYRGS